FVTVFGGLFAYLVSIDFKYIFWIILALIIKNTIIPFAGKSTFAYVKNIQNIHLLLKQANMNWEVPILSLLLLFIMAIIWAIRMTKKANKYVKRTGDMEKLFQEQYDPNRGSSNITSYGKTNPKDKL
ncbi:MAG TPA: hypothetical protein VE912_09105, partial [Bacteroidales bacterium]|nr:hypothetical protein [Bacteroidales bacterium]